MCVEQKGIFCALVKLNGWTAMEEMEQSRAVAYKIIKVIGKNTTNKYRHINGTK